MKTKIILTRRLPDSVETRMRELFDAVLNEFDQPFTQAQLIDAVKTADVLVPTVTDNLNSSIIEQAGPRLRLIASFGTGVDHIDVNAAREKGITVTNTPGVLSEDTADVAMALILAVPRRIVQGDTKIRSGQWDGWSPTGMLGHRINGKRLGIIGMGSIGKLLHEELKHLECLFIIIIEKLCIPQQRQSWRPLIGRMLSKCFPCGYYFGKLSKHNSNTSSFKCA